MFARTFAITDSETEKALTNRAFIAVVDGRKTFGVTDADGLAHIQASSADSVISLHVLFKSPARMLTELSETNTAFTTTAKAQEVMPSQTLIPIAVTVNDRAATRKAIICMVNSLGHTFVERSSWRAAKEKKDMDTDWNYSMIALHHAGRSYSCGCGAKQMLETQKDHLEKFDDIGYHFGIDCSGMIYEGRDIRFKGASVLNHNTGVIGVVLLNDLTTAGEGGDLVALGRWMQEAVGSNTIKPIPPKQTEAVGNLITALRSVFEISHFGGHREYPDQGKDGKICPGNIGMKLVQDIRKDTNLKPPPS